MMDEKRLVIGAEYIRPARRCLTFRGTIENVPDEIWVYIGPDKPADFTGMADDKLRPYHVKVNMHHFKAANNAKKECWVAGGILEDWIEVA